MDRLTELTITTIFMLFIFFATYSLAYAGDKELCMQSPYGGHVTLTVEPCAATTNTSFHRAYYTQLDGVTGEGCYVGDSGVVLIIWKDHPSAYYPASEFGSCDPQEQWKEKLKSEIDV